MAAEWFVAWDENRQSGPHTEVELRAFASGGALQPGMLIWREGLREWAPASQVKGLFSQAKTPSTPPPLPPTQQPPLVPAPVAAPAVTAAVPSVHAAQIQGNSVESPAPSANALSLRSMAPWMIVAALVLVSAGLISLTVLGLAFYGLQNRAEQRAIAENRKEEEDRAEASEAAAKAAAKREEWIKATFQSTLAPKLRASTPPEQTILSEKLKSYRLEGLPTNWESGSTLFRSNVLPTGYSFGSPFLIQNGAGLGFIIAESGLNFSYYQMDLKTGNTRKVSSHQYKLPGKYNSVTFHPRGNGHLLELICHDIAVVERAPKFRGLAHYVQLDLENGRVHEFDISKSSSGNKDFVQEEILKGKLPDNRQPGPKQGDTALRLASLELSKQGLSFEPRNAQLSLENTWKGNWSSQLRDLRLTSAEAPAQLRSLRSKVVSAPSCSLSTDLRTYLDFGIAAADQDQPSLRRFVQTQSSHRLRNLASYELLHCVAASGDHFKDYLAFQQEDPGTPARDLAILRIHEKAFRYAINESTIETFDEYLAAFPHSLQSADAFRHAYDLELEKARFIVDHAADPKEAAEEIGREMYVNWRDTLRAGELTKAQRFWDILRQEVPFNRTKAATSAQDAKDRDIYRAKMLALQEEQNRILGQIRDIQAQQLQVAQDQLMAIREGNNTLEKINRKLPNWNW